MTDWQCSQSTESLTAKLLLLKCILSEWASIIRWEPRQLHHPDCADVWQTFLHATMSPSGQASLTYHRQEDLGPWSVFSWQTWWFVALSPLNCQKAQRPSCGNSTGPHGCWHFWVLDSHLTSYLLSSFPLSFHFIIYFSILLYLDKKILALFQNPICPLDKTWKFGFTAIQLKLLPHS